MRDTTSRLATRATVLGAVTTAVFAMAAAPAQAASPYTDLGNQAGEYASCVKAVGFSGTWVCAEAKGAADNASKAAASLFPNSLHNGKGDAFRHCYWNALMTIDFGSDRAAEVATNHENYAKGPAAEKKMDLANNKTGRSVGKSYTTNAKSKSRCKSLATDGKLVTLK